jgi:hypothetical protein
MEWTIAELQSFVDAEDILEGCDTRREAAIRMCLAFLSVDQKTAWHHWQHYRLLGPEDGLPGRPTAFTGEQRGFVIKYIFNRYFEQRQVTIGDLIRVVGKQFGLDILANTLRKAICCDRRTWSLPT